MDEVVIGESNEVLSLKSKVESLPYDEIRPGLRARLSTEMVKDAIDIGKITPENARQFADSLVEDCNVPVVIGTPDKKVFPVEDIINARPLIVSNMRNAAKEEGINDYDKNVGERRQAARKVIDTLMKEHERQGDKYGPFAQYLAPEQVNQEMGFQAQRLESSKQVLQGVEGQTEKVDDEFVSHLIETDASNVYFGEELQSWLDKRK